jgi:hypothetical protein
MINYDGRVGSKKIMVEQPKEEKLSSLLNHISKLQGKQLNFLRRKYFKVYHSFVLTYKVTRWHTHFPKLFFWQLNFFLRNKTLVIIISMPYPFFHGKFGKLRNN